MAEAHRAERGDKSVFLQALSVGSARLRHLDHDGHRAQHFEKVDRRAGPVMPGVTRRPDFGGRDLSGRWKAEHLDITDVRQVMKQLFVCSVVGEENRKTIAAPAERVEPGL